MYTKLFKIGSFIFTDFMRNNCPYISAGIAFWTLFSLFPIGLAWISVLGYLYPTVEKQDSVVKGIIDLIPVSADYLYVLVADIAEARGTIGGLAIIGLGWAGTAVFSAIRKGINHAWHVTKPHYFLVERAIDLVMLFAIILLGSIQLVFTTNVLGLGTILSIFSNLGFSLILEGLFELLVVVTTVGTFILLYRYVPNTKVTFNDVWIAGIVGGVLFQAVRILLGFLLSNFADLNLVYGSLSALMAILIWAYASALTVMFGAQIGFAYRGLYGSNAGTIKIPQNTIAERVLHKFSRPRSRIRIIMDLVKSTLLPRKGS